MAKKISVKRTPVKKVVSNTEMIINPDMEHLEGLDNYFKCETKKSLSSYVDKAMNIINKLSNEIEINPVRLKRIESAKISFDKLSELPNDLQNCKEKSGLIISELNQLLIKNI
jgi:hypothetical protein